MISRSDRSCNFSYPDIHIIQRLWSTLLLTDTIKVFQFGKCERDKRSSFVLGERASERRASFRVWASSDPFVSLGQREREREIPFFPPDLVNGAETGSFPPRRPTHALARSPDSQIDTRDRERERIGRQCKSGEREGERDEREKRDMDEFKEDVIPTPRRTIID